MDISKLNLEDLGTVNLKDSKAREDIKNMFVDGTNSTLINTISSASYTYLVQSDGLYCISNDDGSQTAINIGSASMSVNNITIASYLFTDKAGGTCCYLKAGSTLTISFHANDVITTLKLYKL